MDGVLNGMKLALDLAVIAWKWMKAAARPRTQIGKAIEAAVKQREAFTNLAMETAKLHLTGQITEEQYAELKGAYTQWANAQMTIADSLGTWRSVLAEARIR